jgi:hypothetical protein
MSERVFQILTAIERRETIATAAGVDHLGQLQATYGGTRWRKMKGRARVEAQSGRIGWAEIHWYECQGIGRRRIKIKYWLEQD